MRCRCIRAALTQSVAALGLNECFDLRVDVAPETAALTSIAARGRSPSWIKTLIEGARAGWLIAGAEGRNSPLFPFLVAEDIR